jgi:hypothetical protein
MRTFDLVFSNFRSNALQDHHDPFAAGSLSPAKYAHNEIAGIPIIQVNGQIAILPVKRIE